MNTSNPQTETFKQFRDSVFSFRGSVALKQITEYFGRLFHFCKTDFINHEEEVIRLVPTLARAKTAEEYKTLFLEDADLLCNINNYAKSGNIDALHAFLVIQKSSIASGIYCLEKDILQKLDIEMDNTTLKYIMQDGERGDNLDIENIPALLIIVAEHNLKIDKYNDLGYEYCLMEAGMMLQNLYISGADKLAIRPMGSYDKRRVLEVLQLSEDEFTPMITAIIGSK